MTEETLSFDVMPFSNGLYYFRFPADDDTAFWNGPYDNFEAANAAAIESLEAFLAAGVLAALGLKN